MIWEVVAGKTYGVHVHVESLECMPAQVSELQRTSDREDAGVKRDQMTSSWHREFSKGALCHVCRPEAFAALREIEDAMRIIEKAESPLSHSLASRTFNNTFWEPDSKASTHCHL